MTRQNFIRSYANDLFLFLLWVFYHLVFHSDLKIVSNTGQEIEFVGKPKYTEQFVYTNYRSENKFYTCKRDAVETNRVLKAFGCLVTWPLHTTHQYHDVSKSDEGTLNMLLIRGIYIHELCFTYHNDGMYLTKQEELLLPGFSFTCKSLEWIRSDR